MQGNARVAKYEEMLDCRMIGFDEAADWPPRAFPLDLRNHTHGFWERREKNSVNCVIGAGTEKRPNPEYASPTIKS